MSSRRGLPEFRKMRHDRHFVEALEKEPLTSIGQLIPIGLIEANREQPRSSLGDLGELVASIRAKGVLEPLLVRAAGGEVGKYQLVAGERRLHAAREAGLHEVPCIVLNVSDQEAIELALVENLQRQDLTPFDEAEGYRTLVDKYRYTHEQVAAAVGKSRTTITEAVRLLAIPPALRDLCRHADIGAKSLLLLIARASSVDEMERLVQEIAEHNLDREAARLSAKGTGGPSQETPDAAAEGTEAPTRRFKPLQIRFKPASDLGIHFSLSIRRPGVSREHVIATLETLLEQLRRGELDDRLAALTDQSDTTE